MFVGFWQVGRVWNNYGTHPPFFSRHLVPQNLGNINLIFIFSILDRGPRKVNDLLASPSNQFRDYSIWNRIDKLVPLNWNCAPQTLKALQKTTKLFSNLDFLVKSGFPTTRDLSPAAPRGVSWKWQKHQKSSFFDKMDFFLFLFLGPMPFFCY